MDRDSRILRRKRPQRLPIREVEAVTREYPDDESTLYAAAFLLSYLWAYIFLLLLSGFVAYFVGDVEVWANSLAVRMPVLRAWVKRLVRAVESPVLLKRRAVLGVSYSTLALSRLLSIGCLSRALPP